MWRTVQNERENETICFFLPIQKENYFSCDITTTDIKYIFDASQYSFTAKAYLTEARDEVGYKCFPWKDIGNKYNFILLTNFENVEEIENEFRNMMEKSESNCELPAIWMLYSLLIFAVVATIIATIFHWWRKGRDRKLLYKLKFIMAMTGNL
uniref:Uncharacterized protein n=1 Tax=Panagrolaimus superbus TaxID=310955 RepID=A0A914YRZ1_9BILA